MLCFRSDQGERMPEVVYHQTHHTAPSNPNKAQYCLGSCAEFCASFFDAFVAIWSAEGLSHWLLKIWNDFE